MGCGRHVKRVHWLWGHVTRVAGLREPVTCAVGDTGCVYVSGYVGCWRQITRVHGCGDLIPGYLIYE